MRKKKYKQIKSTENGYDWRKHKKYLTKNNIEVKASDVLLQLEAKRISDNFKVAYFLQSSLRGIIEACFLKFFYDHFPRQVDTIYKCDGFPCPNLVDCFIQEYRKKLFRLFLDLDQY